MNPKRVVGITLTVIVLLLLAAGVHDRRRRAKSRRKPRAFLRRCSPSPSRQAAGAAPTCRHPVQAPPTETFSGAIVTQVFLLAGRLECHLPRR